MTLQDVIQRPILDLLPHAPPMALLDRATYISEDEFESEVVIRPDSEFCDGEKVGSWVGIEYMAQSIAAFASAEAVLKGESVKVGFLLGSREYRCKTPYFKVGAALRIRVKKVIHDPNGLSVLECSLSQAGQAEAEVVSNLTVYEVPDLQSYLKENVT